MDKIQILLFKLPSATNRTRWPRQLQIRSRGHSCVWWNNKANIRALGLTQMEITTPEHDSLRLLFHCFHGNRSHRWRQGGLNDRYSVHSVVLMSLHKRLHMIWRDQTNYVTCFFRLTAPSRWRQRYRLLSWYFRASRAPLAPKGGSPEASRRWSCLEYPAGCRCRIRRWSGSDT